MSGQGSYIQLVAKGEQDIDLTGNPQMTYFKTVIKRHTNFAKEIHPMSINGVKDFGKLITVKVDRYGDLLGETYIRIETNRIDPQLNTSIVLPRFGFQLIDYIEVKIGETIVDRHYGEWMDIWSQVNFNRVKYDTMEGLISGYFSDDNKTIIYIPLFFWFTQNPGLSLPLISLQYHEVFFNIKLKSRSDIWYIPGNITDINEIQIQKLDVLGTYIILDTGERQFFANSPLDYLITNIQHLNTRYIKPGYYSFSLKPFLHPLIDIFLTCSYHTNTTDITLKNPPFYHFNTYLNSSNYLTSNFRNDGDNIKSLIMKFNNNDRFKRRDGSFFRCVLPYSFYDNSFNQQKMPRIINSNTKNNYIDYHKGGIYVYNFALEPNNLTQPTGSCNFSAIDTPVIDFETNPFDSSINELLLPYVYYKVDIWTRNYNILRIISGMGGLIYTSTYA